MHRHALTDEQWERVQGLLPGQRTGPKATRGDRLFIDAVIYRAKTGIAWRDLPERFGPWKSVYNRFSTGPSAASGPLCSRRCRCESTRQAPSATAPSSERIKTLPEEGGIERNALGHSR